MVKLGLKVEYSGYRKLKKQVHILETKEVRVGFFREDKYNGSESDKRKNYNTGVPVAQIAAYNEYGSRANQRKPRPFMAVAFNDIFKAHKFLGKTLGNILTGGNVSSNLNILGEYYSKIVSNVAKFWLLTGDRNSEGWAKYKGFNSPLDFTRKMIESVKFKIKHKGGDK